MSYDSRCLELAMYFLPGAADDAVVQELAQAIQATVGRFVGELEWEKAKVLDEEFRKDTDEYIEEMSLGGRKYEPGPHGG